MNVLVTGGSRGLGTSIVRLFAKKNWNIIINYNNSCEEAKKLKEELEGTYNVYINTVKCDISNEEEVKRMFKYIESDFGALDCLVNNAGIANDSVFLEKTKEDFTKVYETNLVGAFLCSKYASKILNKDGAIINITSTNGIDTYYSYSADYDASKAALISLTHNLAVELAPIRVNAIAPGWINTEMNKELDKEYVEEECKKILLNRFAEPEEIANVVYFLASSDARYINNTIIRVDGGMNGTGY